ncbi:MAG: hypothetical protein ABJH98_08020 [Reichenbachiella sp.]|uniref:hypothetical protein n=1 Tax=Reichenbachiella sp. TaxID=2184521 RepID=UPI0032994299
MFDGSEYPQSLNEEEFDNWLERGRDSKIAYNYLLIIWDALDEKYLPVYIEDRVGIQLYDPYPYSSSQEALIAVYDLYSEARISLLNQ